MDDRYKQEQIGKIWSSGHKLGLWQKTELAFNQARVFLKIISAEAHEKIKWILLKKPIDLEWWKKEDDKIHHDLNAAINERLRYLPAELQQLFHSLLTSFDDEEPAFARMLRESVVVVLKMYEELDKLLVEMAIRYRYTIMNGRTHGQEAEMQSFGARILSWLAELRIAARQLIQAAKLLRYSKCSGAIGKYGSIPPAAEKEALRILGFKPFYGATQIIPRSLYAPTGQALCNLVMVISKIGLDIRLAARSGLPLMQEPFKKKQTGSSAMPHKKNTIRSEQLEGMARMAKAYMDMITSNIPTWEERAIEQSCVERVAWPDLFHVTAQSLKVIITVLSGLKVYPDNMLTEIYRSRGVYASAEVKEFLKKHLCTTAAGHTYEQVYRIVQLASFNVFEPKPERLTIRNTIASSFEQSTELLEKMKAVCQEEAYAESIEDFIPQGKLRVSEELDLSQDEVGNLNGALQYLFCAECGPAPYPKIVKEWHELFTPAFLLKNEAVLYREIIGQ